MFLLLLIMPLLDLLATISMLLLHHNMAGWRLVFPFAMYLILKGVAFRDVASIIDFVIGLYILGIIAFGFHTFIVYIAAAYLIQKAVFSFF
jgi:hypothetical protein